MMKKIVTLLTLVASTSAVAHPGHVANQSIHSLLHGEHIITLVVTAVITYAVYILQKK